jgi:glycosyltransferase involved in cell wall biosynthesis
MKNVLYIIPNYPCLSETFIQREIEALRKQKTNVYIYALRSEKKHSIKKNGENYIFYRTDIPLMKIIITYFQTWLQNPVIYYKLYCYILSYLKSPQYLLKLFKNYIFVCFLKVLISQRDISIIHAHFGDIATDIALILNKLTGIPYTFSVHAHDFYVKPKNLKMKCKNADCVFTCSQYTEKLLRSRTGMKNIQTVYHGLDLYNPIWKENYQICSRNLPQSYMSLYKIRLIAVGRLVRKKGYHVLINALNILRLNNINFHCTIIGRGKQKGLLENLIRNYELDNNVNLFDALPFHHILEAYKKSHLLIVPSIIDNNGDRDNIPNVILEAQASGVPVIASDLPSIQEVIKHNETGFLVPSNDPYKLAQEIQKIYLDPNRLKSVVLKARDQTEQFFNILINTKQMIQVWNKGH